MALIPSKAKRVVHEQNHGRWPCEDYLGNVVLILGKTTRSPHGEENHGRVLKTVMEMAGRMESSDGRNGRVSFTVSRTCFGDGGRGFGCEILYRFFW